jgi:hypothetical protein
MNINKINRIKLLFVSSLIVSSPAFAADCGGSYSTPGTISCTVPSGVTSIQAMVAGGIGGTGANSASASGGTGGLGGACPATIVTVPGQTINIVIDSGMAASGANGGDGGQAQISGAGMGSVTLFAGGGMGGDGAFVNLPGAGGVGGAAIGSSSCVAGANGSGGVAGASSSAPAGAGATGFVSLTVTTPVAPAAIPTLSEWAMIFMASLMAMFGIRRMRRNK